MSSRRSEVEHRVRELIESGSNYRVDELEKIYHPDLRIVKIDESGKVSVIDRDENLEFFRAKRDSNAPALSTEAVFNYMEAGERTAHVIVTRRMQLADRPEKSIFSLHLVNENGKWLVQRETAFVQSLASQSE